MKGIGWSGDEAAGVEAAIWDFGQMDISGERPGIMSDADYQMQQNDIHQSLPTYVRSLAILFKQIWVMPGMIPCNGWIICKWGVLRR